MPSQSTICIIKSIVITSISVDDILRSIDYPGRIRGIDASGSIEEIRAEIEKQLDLLEDITDLLDRAIIDEPPISLREGGIIKAGYNEQVDRYRHAATDGKKWLAELEVREKEATGIKTLKVGYNHVFGYYIEVTKSYYDLIPDHYIRKQTLANCERFITDDDLTKRCQRGAKEQMEKLWNPEVAAGRIAEFTRRYKAGEAVFIYEDGPLSRAGILKNNWFND